MAQPWEEVRDAIEGLPEKIGREIAQARTAGEAVADQIGVPDIHREEFASDYDHQQAQLLREQRGREQNEASKRREAKPIDHLLAGASHLPFVGEFRQGREQGKSINEAMHGWFGEKKEVPTPDVGGIIEALEERIRSKKVKLATEEDEREERNRNKAKTPLDADDSGEILQSRPATAADFAKVGQDADESLDADTPKVLSSATKKRIDHRLTHLDVDDNTMPSETPRQRKRHGRTEILPAPPEPEPPANVDRGTATLGGTGDAMLGKPELGEASPGGGEEDSRTTKELTEALKKTTEELAKLKTAIERQNQGQGSSGATRGGAAPAQGSGPRVTIGAAGQPGKRLGSANTGGGMEEIRRQQNN